MCGNQFTGSWLFIKVHLPIAGHAKGKGLTVSSKIDFSETCTFQLEMCEMHKTADFHSNLLVSWELATEAINVL